MPEPTRGDTLSPERRALLQKLLREKGVAVTAAPAPIGPRSSDAPAPASFAQQRLWFLDQLEPGNPAYNLFGAHRLAGTLDADALRHALREIVRRHDSLRTAFDTRDGQPVQVVASGETVTIDLPTVDLSHLDPEERDREATRIATNEARLSYDLTRGPLTRFGLLRLDERTHVLLLGMHHAISDGWSLGVFVRELGELYDARAAGRAARLPALPIQYADFAEWQRDWLQGEELERQVSYWRDQLAGAPAVLDVPTDRPRPPMQTFRGARHRFGLDLAETDALKAIAREHDATLFMVLLAGFATLLQRYCGQDDIVVGTPMAGRNRAELENLIGFFVNTLVMRMDLSGDPSFESLLTRVRETALGAYAHADVPFEKLVAELHPERDLSHTPLFQVMFALQDALGGPLELSGLTLDEQEVQATTAKFDITLEMVDDGDGLYAELEYNADLFDRATVERLAANFEVLLEGIAANPTSKVSELPLLTDDERERALADARPQRPSAVSPVTDLVHRRVEAQAAARPVAVAVTCGDAGLTYADLDARANRLAQYLVAHGVGPDVRVAVCLERGLDVVVTLLAVLKAGGAYVPLDADYPAARVAFMIEDSGAALVLTAGDAATRVPATAARVIVLDDHHHATAIGERPATPPVVEVGGETLAYVIYTSGSTGTPKGVLVTHENVARLLTSTAEWFGFDERDVWTLFHSYAFDFSVWEMWGALAHGGRLVVVPHWVTRAPDAFLDLLADERVTVLNQTPSAFYQLARADERATSAPHLALRVVVFGGEALEPARLAGWMARRGDESPRLVNMYGITETTVHVTYRPITTADAALGGSPIGRAIPDLATIVLDRFGNIVPTGVPGELYVGGAGVARGYLGRAGLTAERFVADPCGASGRFYRTGDLVKRLPSGELDYLGRVDQQVKIRGFRIELGEVEAALLRHDAVADAAVEALEDSPGHRRLVAYVVGERERDVSVAELRAHCAGQLPEYMVPATFVTLAALPLTPNGKVDRKALPAPGAARPSLGERYVAPRTAEEELLASLWAEVLGLDKVGVYDNFFELGGDSILSIRIIAAAAQQGVRITPKQVFQHQTVAELARVATVGGGTSADQGAVAGDVPLTPIQAWFFDLGDAAAHHYNQSVLLETPREVDVAALEEAVHALVTHHDALRLRFRRSAGGEWRQENLAIEDATVFSTSAVDGDGLDEACASVQASLDLTDGPIVRAAHFALPDGNGRLLLVVHHLAVDAVSWPVLVDDLLTAYAQLKSGEPAVLPAKTTSFKQWAEHLAAYATTDEARGEASFWLDARRSAAAPLNLPAPGTEGEATRVERSLPEAETATLTRDLPAIAHAQVNEALLAALAIVATRRSGSPRVVIDVEGHGREDVFDDVDLSRTVGWFTTVTPVLIELDDVADALASLRAIKDAVRAMRRHGIGHGILRHLVPDAELRSQLSRLPRAEIAFNYLGRLDHRLDDGAAFRPAGDGRGPERSPGRPRSHALNVDAAVVDGRLEVAWTAVTTGADLEAFAAEFEQALREMLARLPMSGSVGYAPSDFPLARLTQHHLDRLAAACPFGIEDVYPLTPMQQGMVFHTLLAPESGVYYEQGSFLVEGPLDAGAFERAWARVVERHAILRTSIASDGLAEPLQVVHRRVELPFALLDWTGLGAEEQEDQLARRLADERSAGFDLDSAPLMRVTLVRLGADRHQFVWSFHHVLLDGWSVANLLRELLSFYDAFTCGEDLELPSPPPYRGYIAWLAAQDLEVAERYWRDALEGFAEPTPLGVDHKALGAVLAGEVPGTSTTVLDAEETVALIAFARDQRVTLNTVVQGAWALVLSRYSGNDDVVFGATVSGRAAPVAGIESMIGLFINTLPVRVRVDREARATEWLAALQHRQAELRQFEHTPLVSIQSWSNVPRGVPLFESIVVFENYPVGEAPDGESGPLSISGAAVEQTNYALTLAVVPGDELTLTASYDTRRFDVDPIARMLGHLRAVLLALTEDGDRRVADVPMLSPDERTRLLVEWNPAPDLTPPSRLVHELFAERAAAMPDAAALVFRDAQLTYDELDRRANRLANHLHLLGVRPESRVAVYLERGLEPVVAVLAILKAGGAYVPLDPTYPPARIGFMLADSSAAAVITESGLAHRLARASEALVRVEVDREADAISTCAETAPVVALDPANLAYVIYTSGSTGTPKGVMVTHAGVPNMVAAFAQVTGAATTDRALQYSSLGFDASTLDILTTLGTGGTLHLAAADELLGRPLLDVLAEQRITAVTLPPSVLAVLPDDDLPDLRRIQVGGEACPADVVARWSEGRVMFDLYGPTEATVWATWARAVDDGNPPPIGRPIPNAVAHVLDGRLDPVPMGVAGELYLGGIGLARGYLDRPALTAARFVPDPFGPPGSRLYRTGDVVRRRADGQLEFVGRTDDQVKIRGFRVELGEIEAVLSAHPAIQAAAVAVQSDHNGQPRLAAHVVAHEVDAPAADIRAFCREKLPDHMVPAAFVYADELPLTAHGKVDRATLRNARGAAVAARDYVPPRTPIEETIAAVWRDVLDIGQVGVHDDFFELGGHSLLATLAASRLSAALDADIPLAVLFEHSVLADLAAHLDKDGNR